MKRGARRSPPTKALRTARERGEEPPGGPAAVGACPITTAAVGTATALLLAAVRASRPCSVVRSSLVCLSANAEDAVTRSKLADMSDLRIVLLAEGSVHNDGYLHQGKGVVQRKTSGGVMQMTLDETDGWFRAIHTTECALRRISQGKNASGSLRGICILMCRPKCRDLAQYELAQTRLTRRQ